MGRIFTLSGASGVGKTTFLNELSLKMNRLKIIPRYTNRPPRENEKEGFEYYFCSNNEFLQKVFSNDFIHIEKWGDYYSGIESHILDDLVRSDEDGIILASIFSTARLRASYGINVFPIYMWTSERNTLLNPRCLANDSPEVIEIKWRIRKKLVEKGFSEYEKASLTENEFLNKRMIDNFLDIAAVNGRLRAGEDIMVLPNLHDKMYNTIQIFNDVYNSQAKLKGSIYSKNASGCFVLMPFKEEYRPIYEDHIVAVCSDLGVSVSRADQIFSSAPIIDDILEAVSSSKIILADLSDNNPNVFYEVGICHAIGKNVVLITRNDDVPFDVRHIRHIKYNFTPRGMKEFEETLKKTFENTLYK
jgi:guanylate kinase